MDNESSIGADESALETVATETIADESEVIETSNEETQDTEPQESKNVEETIEELEFDFGGNKKKFKKGTPIDEIAEEINAFTKGTWSDYTKKSQQNAEEKKQIEIERQHIQKLQSLQGEALTKYARGEQIKLEIKDLESINLQELYNVDRDQYRLVSDVLSQKRQER